MTRRDVLAALLLGLVLPRAIGAQQSAPDDRDAQSPGTVHGTVLAAESAAPLGSARVSSRRGGRVTTTDPFGRFQLFLLRFPDTLDIAYVGRRRAWVAVSGGQARPLAISLALAPVSLPEVVVRDWSDGGRTTGDVGRWSVPLTAAREVPPAIEVDVFRSLSLVPAVSFSTPLSARPIVRGYDAGESALRIDGFEVMNLYHIGRIFSAFPADASEGVTLTAGPGDVTAGGAIAGTIDIAGRTGEPARTFGGADLSLGSLTGWAGGGGEGTRWFGAARAVQFSLVNRVAGGSVPYDFQDGYLNGLIVRGGRPVGKVTAFASRDHLFDADLGSGMDWNNLLLGARLALAERGGTSLWGWASATRFAEDVSDIAARDSRLDLRNRFARIGSGIDASTVLRHVRIGVGGSLAWRSIDNTITPRSGEDFPPTDTQARRVEAGAYGTASSAFGGTTVELGARLDAAGGLAVWQPRARLAQRLGRATSLGLAAGRSARLYHLISDPQSEPEVAFYDFWRNAGDGVPAAKVDHLALDLVSRHGPLVLRAGAFVSRAHDLIELRPNTEQVTTGLDPFRTGDGRSRGVELQVGVDGAENTAGARRSFTATYVWSRAERRWDDRWIPWSQDRRHLVRLAASVPVGRRVSVFGTFEAASAAPLTPVTDVIVVAQPTPVGPGVTRTNDAGRYAYRFGPENSWTGSGTARADIGLHYRFQGPWRSRMALGFSVVNLGFGPVAPLRPVPPVKLQDGDASVPDGQVTYERLFDLPAVPTLTLRAEF